MKKDRFKELFAGNLVDAFRASYSEIYGAEGDTQVFNSDFVYQQIEKPKDTEMGRYAFPVFRYGKLLGEKPSDIANKIASSVPGVLAVSAFLNWRPEAKEFTSETLRAVLQKKAEYSASDVGKKQRMLVEFSAPNIAKPFGVGHLRSTVIGNSLQRIFRKIGYDTVGINYLGDWGTQFGKMIVAWNKWGGKLDGNNYTVNDLVKLYVRFHTEAEKDDTLNDEARSAFKQLEEGHEKIRSLWKEFVDVSMTEFDRIYKILGVEFDFVTSESALNDKMGAAISRLEKANLTTISEGALVVDLGDPQLPPCLLKKADGATLYATRDIAGLLYRWERYKFAESLYVVGASQSDHFKQVFKVIDLLEQAEKTSEDQRMTGRVKHIPFGWVKFGDKVLATRKGEIILLEDVLSQAAELVSERIKEKNREFYDREAKYKSELGDFPRVADDIGVGAVIFSQLSVRRNKDVNFIWEDVLSFEGETGPYLQYTHARLCAVLRKYAKEVSADFDAGQLNRREDRRVVELLADYPETVYDAARTYEPYLIAAYLCKLCSAFNTVYQRRDEQGRIDKIISDDESFADRTTARMALVKAVKIVLNDGLYLLGLKAPEEM